MRNATVSRVAIHGLTSGRLVLPRGLYFATIAHAIALALIWFTGSSVAAWDEMLAQEAASARDNILDLQAHVVAFDETLYAIAKRYNTDLQVLRRLNGLADSNYVVTGQTLVVPRLDEARVSVYEVQWGDTLFRLARRSGTSVSALRSLNGIGAEGHIQAGETLLLPRTDDKVSHSEFLFGLSLYADENSIETISEQVDRLEVNWVKLELPWSQIEPQRQHYDFVALDATIAALDELGANILLNIFDAPGWSRRSYTAMLNSALLANTGPPEDLSHFENFISALAQRYRGIVDAYEIWKAPNLLKYWTVPIYDRPPQVGPDGNYGIPDRIAIGASHYLDLLKVAYTSIKSVDANALVITGGLAPVGFSDYYNAVETGTFLRAMLLGGVADYSDAIGAIFGASAVPPTLFCCEQPPGVDSHYETYMQYFRDIVYLYRHFLVQNGLEEIPIYVTQVGWGTTEGANLAIPAQGLEWLKYTDQNEQADYIVQAFELAAGLEYIQGMFLYNLNGCSVGDQEACFFSLIDADGSERPAFAAYESLPKAPPQA